MCGNREDYRADNNPRAVSVKMDGNGGRLLVVTMTQLGSCEASF